jgi:hypothetical protein
MDATQAQLSPPPHALRRFLEPWKSIKGNMQCLGVSVWRLLRIIITRVLDSISGRLISLPQSNGSDTQPIQLYLNTGSYAAQTVPPPLPSFTTDNELEGPPPAKSRGTTGTSYSPALGPVVLDDRSPYGAESWEDINHFTLDESTETADRVIQDGDMGSNDNVAHHHREIASPGQDLSELCHCMFPKDIASRKPRTFFMYVIAYIAV